MERDAAEVLSGAFSESFLAVRLLPLGIRGVSQLESAVMHGMFAGVLRHMTWGRAVRFPAHNSMPTFPRNAGGKMKQRQLMIIAVACGLVCAACIALFMVKVQGEASAARAEALARYGGEQVEVCVATRDVAAGERIDVSAME